MGFLYIFLFVLPQNLCCSFHQSCCHCTSASPMAVFTIAHKCFRMFYPSRHLWFDTISKTSASTHRRRRRVQMGLTQRGLDDIGDVVSITQPSHDQSNIITKGQELLRIHFEGHFITSADELYHTVWETYEDHLTIESPFSRILKEKGYSLVPSSTGNPIPREQDEIVLDSDTVLITFQVPETEWERCIQQQQLVKEQQYQQLLRSMARGKFAE